MITKDGLINSALIFICFIVWFALPMSVLSENHPQFVTILKVIGTICGFIGIIRFIIAYKNQNK